MPSDRSAAEVNSGGELLELGDGVEALARRRAEVEGVEGVAADGESVRTSGI